MSLHPASTTLFTPKLLVYKNGDTASILNSKEITFDPNAPLSKVLLDAQKALSMPFKAKQLFSMAGVLIRGAEELSDGLEVVVGCGEPFRSASSLGQASPFRPGSPLSGRSTPTGTGYSYSPSPSPLPSYSSPSPLPTGYSPSPSPVPGYSPSPSPYSPSPSPVPAGYSPSPSPIPSSYSPVPTTSNLQYESTAHVFSHAAPSVFTHATPPVLASLPTSARSSYSQQDLQSNSSYSLTPSSSQASVHSTTTTPRQPPSTSISPRSYTSSPPSTPLTSQALPHPSSVATELQQEHISTPTDSPSPVFTPAESPIPISATESPSLATLSPALTTAHPHAWVLGEGEGRGGGTKERIGAHHDTHVPTVRAVRTPTHTLIHSTASHTPIYWLWGEGEGKGGGTKHRIGNERSRSVHSGSESSESESEAQTESEPASPIIVHDTNTDPITRRLRAWTHGEGEGRGGATKDKIGQKKNRRTEWILGEGEGRGKGTKERIGSRSPISSPPPTHAPASRVRAHWYRQEWILGEGEGRGGAINGKIGGERTLSARPWVMGEGEGRGGATKERIGSRVRASSTSAAFPPRAQRHLSTSALLDGWVWGQGEGRGGATKDKIGVRVSPLPPRRRESNWVLGEGEGRGGATKDRIGSRVPLSPTITHQSWIVGEGEGRGGGTKERIGRTRGHQRSTSNPTTPPVDAFNGWVWGEGEGRGGATKDKIGTEREQKRSSPRKRSNTISSENSSTHYRGASEGWVWGEGEGNGGGTKERIGDRFAFRRNWVWGEGEGKGGGMKERIGERSREERMFQFYAPYGTREEGGGEDDSPSSSPSLSPSDSPTASPNPRHHAQLPILPLSSLSSPSPSLSANVSARSAKSARSSSSPAPYIPASPISKSPSLSSRSPSPSLSTADSPKRKPRSQSNSIASSRTTSPTPSSPSQSPTPSRSPTPSSSRAASTVPTPSPWGARSTTSSRPSSQSSHVSHASSTKPRSQSMGTSPASTPAPSSSPTLSRASTSTRTAAHSPTLSRARATSSHAVGYQIVKEDWLARVMEGLALAGVQGVNAENDRFSTEVRDVAQEHVARMRSAVGQDAVAFQCSIAVVGPPKSGKTSLLHALARELGNELAAAEHWKRTFVFPVCWSSLLATSNDLLSLYNKVVARSLLMIPLVQVVQNLSTKLTTFFATLLSQPHLPRIPTEFSEALPDQVWSLKLLGESIQKAWHNGTSDSFALAIARVPVSISSVFDYSQVLFVYDDLDSAQVLLGRGTNTQSVGAGNGGKMEKRFLTHLNNGDMYLLSGVATKTLLKALADPPVDVASTLDAVSTLDILPPSVFLAKYPECDIDLVIEGRDSQVTLTLEYFGGAPGYLAKLVDLVHSHRKRVEELRENESEGVRTERERIEELHVYQLAKALSSAPMWVKSSQSNSFSLDSPLSARFLPRSLSH